MSTETREMLIRRFQELGEKIDLKAKEQDALKIEAALILRKLRAQVEADGINWFTWAGKHLDMRPTKLRELLRISEAEDPHALIAYLRRQNAKHQRDHRAKREKPKRLDAARRSLIRWAETAALEDVKEVLADVRQRKIRPVSSPDSGTVFRPAA